MNVVDRCIRLPRGYGIVLRMSSIKRIGETVDTIAALLEFRSPFDGNDHVVTFGPCFGGEAADEFIRRLEVIGLRYIDDFFLFSGDFPEWCSFRVEII